MPTYAYACSSCGYRFDIYQAFSDDALTECSECGGALRKQFGNVGVVFKGSGFYRNDARGSGTSDGSSADSSGSESSSSTKEPAAKGSDSKDSSGGSTTASSTTSTPAPAAAGTSSGSSSSKAS